MNFNFNGNEIAGIGEVRKSLEGNKIHDVTFDGCEAVEFKDGTMKVLRIKFSNAEGSFSHTIFEPKDGDDKDIDGMYGKQPSRIKEMMTLFRHLGNAVCPELVTFIDNISGNITWDQIRKKVVEVTTPAIGTQTKIKLLTRKRVDNNTGETHYEATFPSYFLGYSREGRLYMKTNFIGPKTYFLDKELTAIKKQETEKPVSISNNIGNIDTFDAPAAAAAAPDAFDIDIDSI